MFHNFKNKFYRLFVPHWCSVFLVISFYCINVKEVKCFPSSANLDAKPIVHTDDEGNVYFDIYAITGEENKIMSTENGLLFVSIATPETIQNTFEKELWRFITSILNEDMSTIEILLFPGEVVRRVLLRKSRLTESECQTKIEEFLESYSPHPGKSESLPLLSPYNNIAIYGQNDTEMAKEGPLKYYEIDLAETPKEKKSETKSKLKNQKKLLEMKPFYEKDPSLMAKILRDLNLNKEVVFRGRLLPGSQTRPILDDYRGSKKVKMVRRILEGVADESGVHRPRAKLRFEMSQPVPDLMLLDYLSPNKQVVVSRRVVNPLFRNETVDLVEEFEYTEVI